MPANHLLTPEQHRRRARWLRQWRRSRAAELHELAAEMQEKLARGRDTIVSHWQPNAPSITPAPDNFGCQ
jgi:hypothetical protein